MMKKFLSLTLLWTKMWHLENSLRMLEFQVSKTLMVSNIPKDKCFRSVVLQHFA